MRTAVASGTCFALAEMLRVPYMQILIKLYGTPLLPLHGRARKTSLRLLRARCLRRLQGLLLVVVRLRLLEEALRSGFAVFPLFNIIIKVL